MNKEKVSEIIFQYLQDQGYRPKLDADKDIILSKEGLTFCIVLPDESESYYQIILQAKIDSVARNFMELTIMTITRRIRAIKGWLKGDVMTLTIECYHDRPTEFITYLERYFMHILGAVSMCRDLMVSVDAQEREDTGHETHATVLPDETALIVD